MINPKCDFKIGTECEGELIHYGAILFGPPTGKNKVQKYHICIECYNALMKMIVYFEDTRKRKKEIKRKINAS